jgi:hypothetical protein
MKRVFSDYLEGRIGFEEFRDKFFSGYSSLSIPKNMANLFHDLALEVDQLDSKRSGKSQFRICSNRVDDSRVKTIVKAIVETTTIE